MARTDVEWETPPDVPPTHYLDNRIYTDEALFAEEQDRIFAATWKFCCHESEVADAGDYRAATIAGKPIFLVRGEDGEIRGFYNACPHRGARLVRRPSGNAKAITCLFHHWTFDGRGACTAISRPEAYDHCALGPGDCALRQVRTEIRHGLVFCNLDDEAAPFEDQYGDALSGMADILDRGPLEVFHFHRAVLPTNWKLWVATNAEVYHVHLHVVNRETSFKSPGWFERETVVHPGGHSSLAPVDIAYGGFRQGEKRWESRALTLPGMKPNEFRVATYFPDLTINIRSSVMRIDSVVPLGARRVAVEFRGLGVRGEPESDRRTRIDNHNQFWGPFGRNLPEDGIAACAQMSAMANGASRYSIIARNETGAPTMDDEPLRAYYREWSRLMGRPAHDPLGEP